jgi:Tachylectin
MRRRGLEWLRRALGVQVVVTVGVALLVGSPTDASGTMPASAAHRLANTPEPSLPQAPVPPTMPVDRLAPAPPKVPGRDGRIHTSGQVGCGPVTLYTLGVDGALWWMRDPNPFSTAELPQRGRTAIGRGFGLGYQTTWFGAAGAGVLYRVDNYGRLFWYRHLDPVRGRVSWANAGRGLVIGTGLDSTVVGSLAVGPRGDLYLITTDGVLWLYRHTGWLTGAATWANGGRPIRLGSGFAWSDRLYPAGDGVLYRSHGNHVVSWYRYRLSGARATWANRGMVSTVGRDLDGELLSLTSAGGGVLYRAGRASWASLRGRLVADTAVLPHGLGIGLAADPTACTLR